MHCVNSIYIADTHISVYDTYKGGSKMIKRAGIYARVSTKDQNTEQQLEELKEYCKRAGIEIINEYIDDGVSAFCKNRPAFMELIEDVRKKKINVVIVWKLDRLSRSLKDLIATIEYFKSHNTEFISYSQNGIDTSTSTGKLLFNLFGMIAEFERDLISERTKLKLNFLKKNGIKLGRPNKIDLKMAYKLRNEGLSLSRIASQLNCDPSTVSKVLKKGYQKDMHKITGI